jgi:7-carboxy-7-deazaguanine synthase
MKVNEIFTSIQGETSFAGLPFTFVRLTGCNLRCTYCDTQYAYEEGKEYSIKVVLSEVSTREFPRVVITGGEPLLQEDTPKLCADLAAKGFTVLLETNGSRSVREIDKRIHKIVDIKCPGSGMHAHMDFSNMNYLQNRDEVKFVVSSRIDFEWAREVTKKYALQKKTNVLFSPAYGVLQPADLAKWILDAKLDVRMQLQLHKYIWPDRDRGV